MLTLAFANAIEGHEADFSEWYATRHIRHALNVPALVSGQCLQRTSFQQAGALRPAFSTIAVYELEGGPEDILASFRELPDSLFEFPTLDAANFAEWVYEPLGDLPNLSVSP